MLPPSPSVYLTDHAGVLSTDGKVLVWNLPGEKPAHSLTAGAAVRCVALSADGKMLASGGDDNSVQLWDPAAGKQLRKLE